VRLGEVGLTSFCAGDISVLKSKSESGCHFLIRPMLKLDQSMNIHLLRKEGHSLRQIARLSDHSRNTVRKALKQQRIGK
jgi:DNA-binding CsgD family transcriptional regulator